MEQIYLGFKPCYKWIAFNTVEKIILIAEAIVLNLIITGIPSILFDITVLECDKWVGF